MTAFEPVFFDTTPFIYLVENHPKYYDRVVEFINRELNEKENRIVTSVVSVTEFGIAPKRNNQAQLITDFSNVLKNLDIKVFDITYQVADNASSLRSRYNFLKTIDGLQLACALTFGCRRFFTNDIRLKSINELEIILVENL